MPQIRLKKPKAIMFDISGTTAYTSFSDRTLAAYLRKTVRSFVVSNFNNPQVKRDLDQIKASARSNWPKLSLESAEAAGKSVEDMVNFSLDNEDADCLGLAQLRFHIWFDGYQKGQLVTSIYSDVAIQMKRWRCDYNIKLYVVSQGWSEANKVFMSRTNQGDMTLLIDGYYDTRNGKWSETGSFQKLLGEIGVPASDVVIFTHSGSTARGAQSANIFPILVVTHKKCFDALNEEEKKMAVIRTMNEVEFD